MPGMSLSRRIGGHRLLPPRARRGRGRRRGGRPDAGRGRRAPRHVRGGRRRLAPTPPPRVAAAAGAEVVVPRRQPGPGRGRARRAWPRPCARGAEVVAFCDADGEYAPEELRRAGGADPRRRGRLRGRLPLRRRAARDAPHRWVGNRRAHRVRAAARRDPASRSPTARAGYRALSAEAAAAAEVIHDFNYAQVLTLDLVRQGLPLRRGADLLPVPHRRPLVRPAGPYLRKVVPAVWRVQRRHRSAPVDTTGSLLGRVNT